MFFEPKIEGSRTRFGALKLSVANGAALATMKASRVEVMPSLPAFEIDDARSFEERLEAFCDSLASQDAALTAAMKVEFPRLLRGEISRAEFWTKLYAATGDAS